MKNLAQTEYQAYFQRYIDKVDDVPLQEAFGIHQQETIGFLSTIPATKANYRYAPEKWSVKELLRHVIDTERIFAYRALVLARVPGSDLPGFDENEYAQTADTAPDIATLVQELQVVRRSTVMLFDSFNEQVLANTGVVDGKAMSVRAIGYIIIGHALYHNNIIKERYLS